MTDFIVKQLAEGELSDGHTKLLQKLFNVFQGGSDEVEIVYVTPTPLDTNTPYDCAFYPYWKVTTRGLHRGIPEIWYYGWKDNVMCAGPVPPEMFISVQPI